jgi:hypothetical protein
MTMLNSAVIEKKTYVHRTSGKVYETAPASIGRPATCPEFIVPAGEHYGKKTMRMLTIHYVVKGA